MPAVVTLKKPVWQRQIPTIFGLLILVIALGVGLFFFSDGLGVFAPRATPQTTPKSIKITNVTDTSFSVSFLTDESTVGFVKYGTSAEDLRSQASDDRDQLSGSVGQYTLHHITVRSLQPNTTYHFNLGTNSRSEFNNQGSPFTVQTAATGTPDAAAKTIYGNVTGVGGSPAAGSVVYISAEGLGELSALVKDSGSWAMPLTTARNEDGTEFANLSDDDVLTVTVQGPLSTQVTQTTVAIKDAQPMASISLDPNVVSSATTTEPSSSPSPQIPVLTPDPTIEPSPNPNAATGQLASLVGDELGGDDVSDETGAIEATSIIVDLSETTPQVVDTPQPVITGVAAPNTMVRIQVHSENQVEQEVMADETGQFVFDLAELETQLEPGQHTVIYSYTDANGQPQEKTATFTVSAKARTSSNLARSSSSTSTLGSQTESTQLAQATGPFGSGNPFPVGGVPSPSPSPSLEPSPTATATQSASPSARPARPSTSSGMPVSGSTDTTFALIIGGLFFVFAGGWSFWVARHVVEKVENRGQE